MPALCDEEFALRVGDYARRGAVSSATSYIKAPGLPA